MVSRSASVTFLLILDSLNPRLKRHDEIDVLNAVVLRHDAAERADLGDASRVFVLQADLGNANADMTNNSSAFSRVSLGGRTPPTLFPPSVFRHASALRGHWLDVAHEGEFCHNLFGRGRIDPESTGGISRRPFAFRCVLDRSRQ